MKDHSEEESDMNETSFTVEHDRLAAEYQNERALLEEALRKSKDTFKNISDDESTGDVDVSTSVEGKSVGKSVQFKKYAPLHPIPASRKEADENKVHIFYSFCTYVCDLNRSMKANFCKRNDTFNSIIYIIQYIYEYEI